MATTNEEKGVLFRFGILADAFKNVFNEVNPFSKDPDAVIFDNKWKPLKNTKHWIKLTNIRAPEGHTIFDHTDLQVSFEIYNPKGEKFVEGYRTLHNWQESDWGGRYHSYRIAKALADIEDNTIAQHIGVEEEEE